MQRLWENKGSNHEQNTYQPWDSPRSVAVKQYMKKALRKSLTWYLVNRRHQIGKCFPFLFPSFLELTI